MAWDRFGMLYLGFFQHCWNFLPGAVFWDIPVFLGLFWCPSHSLGSSGTGSPQEGLETPRDGPGWVWDAPFGVFPTWLEVPAWGIALGHSQYFGTFLVSIPLFQALLADPGGGRARAASPGSVPVPGAAFPAEGAHQQVQDTAIVPRLGLAGIPGSHGGSSRCSGLDFGGVTPVRVALLHQGWASPDPSGLARRGRSSLADVPHCDTVSPPKAR